MKRIAIALAFVLFASSLTGCGCFRRIRGTLCPGAYCGSRTPLLSSIRAPAVVPAPVVTQPQVVSAPQYVQPQIIRPQVMQPRVCAPQCVPCCPCPCPCPTTVCDPCCGGYDDCCVGYGNECGYSGDCGCDAPFGIEVAPGEYLGGVETGDWQNSGEPTDAADPGPAR